MTQQDMDRAPDMVTFTIGEDDDPILLSIPESSLKGLEPGKKEETILAISRFIIALAGGKADTLGEDLAIIACIEGMQMTLPGKIQPLIIQEFFGGLIASGSKLDIALIQFGE